MSWWRVGWGVMGALELGDSITSTTPALVPTWCLLPPPYAPLSLSTQPSSARSVATVRLPAPGWFRASHVMHVCRPTPEEPLTGAGGSRVGFPEALHASSPAFMAQTDTHMLGVCA